VILIFINLKGTEAITHFTMNPATLNKNPEFEKSHDENSFQLDRMGRSR